MEQGALERLNAANLTQIYIFFFWKHSIFFSSFYLSDEKQHDIIYTWKKLFRIRGNNREDYYYASTGENRK